MPYEMSLPEAINKLATCEKSITHVARHAHIPVGLRRQILDLTRTLHMLTARVDEYERRLRRSYPDGDK